MFTPYSTLDASQGYIRPSESGAITFLATAPKHMIFTLTATGTITMPSTGVTKGQKWFFENTSTTFDLVVNASGGSALTTANSCNMDATIRSGKVLLVALQDAPTLPAHWRVIDVEETGSYTDTTTGAITQTVTVTWYRKNKIVVMNAGTPAASASASNSIGIPATNNPVRIRPSGVRYGATEVESNSSTIVGLFTINSTGTIGFNKYDVSTFTGTAGLGDGTAPNTFSYLQ